MEFKQKPAYKGYRAYQYLEAGKDYKDFEWADWDWAGRHVIELSNEQEAMVSEILAKYREKYIPVQKKYLEMYKPREKSDLVIDNSNPLFPKVMKDMPGSKS